MRRRVKLFAVAVALVLVAAVDSATNDSMLLPAAYAQDQTPGQKTRKTPAMRESVYKKLSEAQEASEAGRESEALAILDDLKRDKNLNSYELAQLYSFYGFVYFNRERYNDSIQAYETVLRQSDLPEAMELSTIYTLAQLYFTVERYDEAAKKLEQWFRLTTNPGSEPYVLLGQAYYSLDRYEDAIPPIEKAIELARANGKETKENWWLLLRVCYYELENYPKVVEILEELLKYEQKKEYWTQLSAMYSEIGDDRKQMLAYEMAYIQGFLDREQELLTLAQLYMQSGVPWRGSQVLEKGFGSDIIEKNASNYRLLAQSYQMAQEDEKSIAPLTQAATLSGDGELSVRLAQAYVNLGRWEEAAEAAREGIRKGGLNRTDSANVLLGMSLFNLKRYGPARSAFAEAQKDSRSSAMASQWIAYIGKEQERESELQRALQ